MSELLGLRDVQFEEDRVRFVLTSLGMVGLIPDLVREHESLTGAKRLTFAMFNQEVSAFPLHLGASRAYWGAGRGAESPVSDMLRGFASSPLVAQFERFRDSHAGVPKPKGLVVPFGRYRQGLIIHEAEGLWRAGTAMTKLVHDGGTRERPYRVYAEPFKPLVLSIAAEGLPSVGDGAWTDALHDLWRPGRGATLLTWLLRVTGGDMSKAILLSHLLAPRGPLDPPLGPWVLRDGVRWLAKSYDELSEETGLSRATLCRAVRDLVETGFLESRCAPREGHKVLHTRPVRRNLRVAVEEWSSTHGVA